MEKKIIQNENCSQPLPAIAYKVSMKVHDQPFIQLYELNSLDDAIKAALSVYAHIPTTMQVVLIDSAGVTHLTLNRYA